MRAKSWIGLLLWLVVCASQVAFAQEDAEQEEAREHFRRGQAAYQRGDYEKAITEWQAAYESSQKPRIQYNLAQAYERLGRLNDAVSALKHYVDNAEPDDSAQSDAVARLASLQQRLALTGIQIKGGVEGALIKVDDREWGRTPRPDKIFVKPGSHSVVVSKEGYQDFVSSVVVAAGQVAEVNVVMNQVGETPAEEGPTEVTPTPTPEEEPTETVKEPEAIKDEVQASTDNSLIWFIVSGGLAAGAIGSGIWFADRGSALSECDEDKIYCENEDSIETQGTVALVLTIGLGAGAIGALVVGILSMGGDDETEQAATTCYPTSLSSAGCTFRF